jgi:hypothetical protein
LLNGTLLKSGTRKSQREKARKQTKAESQVFMERENLKRKLGPGLRHSFRGMIVAQCEEVNKELGKEHYRCHDEFPNKLRVIGLNPVANLRLEFSLMAAESSTTAANAWVNISSE